MKQKIFNLLSFADMVLVFVCALVLISCSEEEPSMFTTERIVINCTDSVTDASISPGSRTRSVPESTKIGSSVLTSKTGKKMHLSCTETSWPVEKTAQTRGAKVTTATIGTIGISASVYPIANSYTSAGCGSYFYKEAVTSGTPTKYYWPTSDYRISFFGYYPYNNAAFSVLSAADATGAPMYAYTVPSTISNQLDIMTGQDVDHHGGSSSPVNMTLAHRCSAIHFSVTNDRSEAITVNSISIEGVKYTGTLSGSTWTLGSGVNSSSTNPFTLTYDSSVEAGATIDITGTSNIFMMLPQTLPSGAKLKVVVDDEEFEAELIGTWVSGMEYTYSLSFMEPWEYFLNVTGPTSYTYTGGTNSYSIQSYRQKDDGAVTEAAPWTVTFDTDGDGVFDNPKPDWLTTFTESGNGSTTASNYNATISAQVYSSSLGSGTTASILAAATPVGSSSDYYDLSINGGSSSMTTANCYMIHAPGYYKLPLVYGNAIKNGTDNQTAYKPGTVSNGTDNFINHADSKISAPWITKSGSGVNGGMNITVNGAQLIWQDVKNLTSDYAIDGDYLKFQVPAESIAEGNAVIAVKSGSTIVWSWHIWVTPETYSNLTTVATGSHNYSVTPVNLGWVGSGSITKSGYESRSCDVKVTQSGGGQTQIFTITQSPNITVTTSKGGNSPFYQWGRKDPFVPSNGSSTTNKTVYVGSGVPAAGWEYQAASSSTTIGTNIQNPWKHYYYSSNSGPVGTTYYNMWDAKNASTDNVTTATKKTIYDPCPPGFCVPTGNLYYYMGNGGSRTMSTFDTTNKGATWNTGITGDALWFPAAGFRRYSSGSLANVGSHGYYFSATPVGTIQGRSLAFNSSSWYWSNNYRAYGCSIRPVAEE